MTTKIYVRCALCGWVHVALTREQARVLCGSLSAADAEAMGTCGSCGRVPPAWRAADASELLGGATVPACIVEGVPTIHD
jgi:uncharacterized Zn finger protein